MSFVLLGILNSQAAGGAPVGSGDFDLLETTILGSSASSVTFTGLGSYTDYKHLQIRAVVRSDRADSTDVLDITFNSDTGSNYAFHALRGNGSSVAASAGTSQTDISLQQFPSANAGANIFGAFVIDILDFSSASKNTTLRSLHGHNVGSYVALASGLYNSTNAITSIEFDKIGTNFVTGTRFSLYGLKESV